MPTVSAIIPVYNGARFLRKAIDSVLTQSESPREVIVLDDGSTDNTREVVERYGSAVKYVYQSNRGLAAARNAGVAASSGDWLAFLDCDDWWLPQKLKLQLEAIRQHPEAILVYADQWILDLGGRMIYDRATPPDALWPMLRAQNRIGSPVVVIKRAPFVAIGGYDERLRACEDWDLYVRLISRGEFISIPQPLAVYRQSQGTLSKDPDRMLMNFEQILEQTLLRDLNGAARHIWRRRIRSQQLLSAGLMSRDAGDSRKHIGLLLRSLLQWPSPFWLPKRWGTLLVSLARMFK
jgi:glycosyltransferase involved in cell wall biosynthesis